MFRSSIVRSLVSTASVCLISAGVAHAQPTVSYQLTDLGALPNSSVCEAESINDAGVVAGYCGVDGTFMTTTGFVYSGGVMTSIGKLPAGHYSVGWAVNASGAMVGEGDTGDFQPRAILRRDGALLNIDPTGGANVRAIGISDGGVIAGDFASGLSGNTSSWRAVIWTEDSNHPGRFGRVTLPVAPGGTTKARSTYAIASNQAGHVVGWATNSIFGQRAAFWNNDAAHTLTTLDGPVPSTTSIAAAVNINGVVVGTSANLQGGSTATVWMNDASHTAVDLGALAGDLGSSANAINAAGVVVGSSQRADGTVRAFVWTNGTMSDLTALVDASGTGYGIQIANAINSLGQIAATAVMNGQRRAVVLTPVR